MIVDTNTFNSCQTQKVVYVKQYLLPIIRWHFLLFLICGWYQKSRSVERVLCWKNGIIKLFLTNMASGLAETVAELFL